MSAHSEAAQGFVLSAEFRLMLDTMSGDARMRILNRAYEMFSGIEGAPLANLSEERAAGVVARRAHEINKALTKRQEQSKNARAVGKMNRENISRTSHDGLTTSQEERGEESPSPTPPTKEEPKEESSLSTRARKVFVPPTVDDVRAYCLERSNGISAEEFVDFYTGKGWMIGKNKMVDWRAAVRTWERGRNANNRGVNGGRTCVTGSGHSLRTVTAGNFRGGTESQRAEATAVL